MEAVHGIFLKVTVVNQVLGGSGGQKVALVEVFRFAEELDGIIRRIVRKTEEVEV